MEYVVRFCHGVFYGIGLPEVDRITQAWKFGTQTTPTNSLTRRGALLKDKNSIEDRISRLPGHVLQFIISLLTMREGVATSILSSRWSNLWSTSVSILNFDAPNMIGHGYPYNITKSSLMIERYKFIKWVNQILELHRASKIDALRVCFVLDKEFASHINQWIKTAMDRGATELELDFEFLYFCKWGYPSHHSLYEFPFELCGSSLKYLRLSASVFRFPPGYKGFNSLISLTLEHVCLVKDSVQNILSNCSFLEWLSLRQCKYLGGLTNLKFSGLSLLLKHLCLHMADCDGIRMIEVHDVNIMSFEYSGFAAKVSIKNAPCLERLVLCTHTPLDILSNVPRLKTLFLTAWVWFEESIVPRLSLFNNLKRLVFLANGEYTNLLEVIHFLEACPMLQKLELDMGVSLKRGNGLTENLTKIATRPGSPHNNLKEIEIYGFQQYPEKLELVEYLLRNAIVLEKIKVSTATKKYFGNGKWVFKGSVKQQGISFQKE